MKGKYCYSFDGDPFHGESFYGDYNTLEELFAELNTLFPVKSDICIGKYKDRAFVDTSGFDIIELIEEQLNSDYHFEDSPFELCKGDLSILRKRLDKVIEEFFKEFPIDHWTVTTELTQAENEKIEEWRIR